MFILRHEGLDDPPEVTCHDTQEAAIEAAAAWFVGGYEGDEPESLGEHVSRLRANLNAGEPFYCSLFGERVSLLPDAG